MSNKESWKRTKNVKIIPDVINCKPSENFTQVRNDVLRNPDLSLKAKGLLTFLLSNKKGWNSCIESIKKATRDGEKSIRSGLKELEEQKYLLRIRYRDKERKTIKGMFWAYTDVPGNFELDDPIEILNENGYEVIHNTENPSTGFPSSRKAKRANPTSNNTIFKNTDYSKKSVSFKKDNLTDFELSIQNSIIKQINEVLEIPELTDLVNTPFINEIKKYIPSKKEISYFIEHFDSKLLDYYKEYLIYSILEEKLYFSDTGEMLIPRLALLNSNSVRRSQLIYSMENYEDIQYSLSKINKSSKEKEMNKEEINTYVPNNKTFSDFIKEQPTLKNEDMNNKVEPDIPEKEFLNNLHKLDNKDLDDISEDDIEDYIEELLSEG